jgi:hypothetical protein
VWGAVTAAGLPVQVPTAVLATVLSALGGFAAAGWASVAVLLLAAVLAARLPDVRVAEEDEEPPLRVAVRGWPPALWAVGAAVAYVGGLDALEEYTPVMAAGWGVPTTAVPLALLAVPLAGALGAVLGGRGAVPAGPLLAGSGVLLAAAAAEGGPAALALLAVAYGAYRAALVAAEARLQATIAGPARATVTSVAGVGAELSAFLVYGAWAVGAVPGIAVLLLAGVLVVGPALRRRQPAG